MVEEAWHKQSESLVEVQKRGSGLEAVVRSILRWPGGRVTYDHRRGYMLQVDFVYPAKERPQTLLSVTYTKPDTRGHSNENKLQLKLGELALLKNAYPDLRMVLAIGGSSDDWLPYVLKAFKVLYDETIHLWNESERDRLQEIASSPLSVPLRHKSLWANLRADWGERNLSPEGTAPSSSQVRHNILNIIRGSQARITHPSSIKNEIVRMCMQKSYDSSGKEWLSYRDQDWDKLEMSRNYFNPLEAIVEITLKNARLDFEGGLGNDVQLRSLLHELGMTSTSVSEDFSLYSERLDVPVYIQCKASGGGHKQHGKNIQNRTKEQIARSIIYRCRATPDGVIEWGPKTFHWIAVLDGNWGVTRRQPLKYIHMLQLAGYDKIFSAGELLKASYNVKGDDNPLADYLVNYLCCRRR